MGCESNSSRTISETIYENVDVNFKPPIHGLKMNRKWMANSEPNSGKRMQKLTSTFAADSKIQLKGCSFQIVIIVRLAACATIRRFRALYFELERKQKTQLARTYREF